MLKYKACFLAKTKLMSVTGAYALCNPGLDIRIRGVLTAEYFNDKCLSIKTHVGCLSIVVLANSTLDVIVHPDFFYSGLNHFPGVIPAAHTIERSENFFNLPGAAHIGSNLIVEIAICHVDISVVTTPLHKLMVVHAGIVFGIAEAGVDCTPHIVPLHFRNFHIFVEDVYDIGFSTLGQTRMNGSYYDADA